MKLKGFQNGLIFKHFPEFMFFATGFFKSDAHMMLQFARLAHEDKSITSDKKIFRDFRENKCTPEQLADYLSGDNEKLKDLMLSSLLLIEDPKNIGGWYVLANLVYGFKQSIEHEGILNYLSFVEELCFVDKKYIIQQQEVSRSVDLDTINDAINLWLDTGEIDITSPTDETKTKCLVALVLHWAALYESFLFVQFRALTTNNCDCYSLFLDCLPTIGANGKLKRSNSVLLELMKKDWAKSQYKKTKMTWSKFSCDIAKARHEQNLSITELEDETPDLEKPNPQIEKRLKRWRGKDGETKLSFISIDDFKQYIEILKAPYDPGYYDTASVRLLFTNLFELIQFELQKTNISDQFIADEFANYPKYQELVNKRYQYFVDKGILKP